MNKMLAISMLALFATAVYVPPASAETVSLVCAATTVLTGSDLSNTFSMTVCGTGIGWVIVRNPTSSSVSWTITTDTDSATCTWPPNSGASCSHGGGPVPGSLGATAEVTITSDAGDIVANWTPGA